MKLHYYKAPLGNIGDDLNPWLWPKIFGKLLNRNSDHLLIGIGTLLNHKIKNVNECTVLTSGVGYGRLPNLGDGKWNFTALRGPITKKALQISKPICLLDGAYLMPRFFKPSKSNQFKAGYVPHIDSILHGQWEYICQQANIKYLDPRLPVEQFISELNCCQTIITEAMHGAILADAYKVPWQPTKCYEYINEQKWSDWGQSLNLKINFNFLPSIYKGDVGKPLTRKFINNVKRLCKVLGYYSSHWDPVFPLKSSNRNIEQTISLLLDNQLNKPFYLSNENLKCNRTDLLLEEIEKLKSNLHSPTKGNI